MIDPHVRRARLRRAGAAVALATGLTAGLAVDVAVAARAPSYAPSAADVVGLRKGASGDAVRALQQALGRAGVSVHGGADGYFGAATESALRSFQQASGLSVTGVVSERTAAYLGFTASGASGGSGSGARGSGASSASASSGTLTVGSTGDAVRQLQQRLIAVGFPIRGGADGVYGASTADAVRDFQEAQGYKVTGSTNPATMKALGLTSGSSSSGSAPSGSSSGAAGLGRGARGGSVKVLQQALIGAGITLAGGADGVFGTATENALKAFQQARGLAASGVLDDPTAAALGLNGYGPPRSTSAAAAPATGTATSIVGLQLGARGPAVVTLQQRIIELGWPLRGGADGVFGAATQSRVLQFQRANGLAATGVVDQRTARAMGLAGGSSSGSSSSASAPTSTGSTASGFPRYDERGGRVVALQQALIGAGIALRGGADGIFGSATAGGIMTFQRARGLAVTGKVDQATAAALGLSPAPEPDPGPAINVSLEAKPVQGPCDYRDTWNAARGDGRVHLGTDIIAAQGKELYAVASGTITTIYTDAPGSRSGNALKLTRPDGTYFFYGHLSAFAPGIAEGTAVSAGQLVGYVGMTGNAGTPHLHLEVHPGGGSAVNPYSIIRAIGAC